MSTTLTTNWAHDDSSSDITYWSDLSHDVLFFVMMQLGIADFLSFTAVCKSWRSVANLNKNMFMASKPPMLMSISPYGNNDMECCLEDYEGRKFKTTLPHSAGWSFSGLTCGYLILFNSKTGDCWLVNPITKHELHLPRAPGFFSNRSVALVFSHSISRYVFFMLNTSRNNLWYCIAGEESWNLVPSIHRFHSFYAFKGKIYTVCSTRCLCELTFKFEPKLTLLKTKNLLEEDLHDSEVLGLGENLYFMKKLSAGEELYNIYKLDIGKKEWVKFEGTIDEHGFFLSYSKYGAVVKLDSWADTMSQNGRVTRHGRVFDAKQWYFPHECLNVNLLNES